MFYPVDIPGDLGGRRMGKSLDCRRMSADVQNVQVLDLKGSNQDIHQGGDPSKIIARALEYRWNVSGGPRNTADNHLAWLMKACVWDYGQ